MELFGNIGIEIQKFKDGFRGRRRAGICPIRPGFCRGRQCLKRSLNALVGGAMSDEANEPSKEEHDDPVRHNDRSAEDPFPWTLELALSGGGFRASAYALGALLYVVHGGLNTKVKNIASVSGSSITNAFVANNCDFMNVGADEFRNVVRQLARKLATRGLIQ